MKSARLVLVLAISALSLAWDSPVHAESEAEQTSASQVDTPLLSLPPHSLDADANIRAILPSLAAQLAENYHEPDRATYLDNLFRLQLVAGRFDDAVHSIRELRALRTRTDASTQARATNMQYEILALAEARHLRGDPLKTSFAAEFRNQLATLDDPTSAMILRMLNVEDTGGLSLIVDSTELRRNFTDVLESLKGRTSITDADLLGLIRAYQISENYRVMAPFLKSLIREDDRRRYILNGNIRVRTRDGAAVCAFVVRPREAPQRRPALLDFTIYGDLPSALSEARRSASRGYAGVAGFSRGKLCGSGTPVPMEHDGADAADLISWISRQPWSDGRVGMFGASYDGFTVWAAAKYHPKALKALMPAVTLAPGIDVPSEGSVVQSGSLYWPLYVATNKTLNGPAFEDQMRWRKLFRVWYISGRAYRDLVSMDGQANPIWDRWMRHPSYDSYWSQMIPFGSQFAEIKIPVLTTTGYYDGGQVGATYYFREHHRYLPSAEHYLLIGPYTHATGNRGTTGLLGDVQRTLSGYRLDDSALIDLGDLRYEWFDYVLRHGPKPAILADKVNFEIMGANQWGHAPSISTMTHGKLRLFLGPTVPDGSHALSPAQVTHDTAANLTVDLANRSDIDQEAPGGGVLDDAIDHSDALVFRSEPLKEGAEIAGLFSGKLVFVSNKRDFDFSIRLYQETPTGKFFELSWYQARASFVANRRHRRLLTPGKVEKELFTAERLTARQLEPGSRLVAVVGVIKGPTAQINYGSGKPVNDETIADAGAALRIEFSGESFLELPITWRNGVD